MSSGAAAAIRKAWSRWKDNPASAPACIRERTNAGSSGETDCRGWPHGLALQKQARPRRAALLKPGSRADYLCGLRRRAMKPIAPLTYH